MAKYWNKPVVVVVMALTTFGIAGALVFREAVTGAITQPIIGLEFIFYTLFE